jgi:hypothetical protein
MNTADKREVAMSDDKKPIQNQSDQPNEGEGNRTAARHYNQAQHQFAKSGKVEPKAREARAAIDGPEGKVLKQAEKVGRSHGHGKDPLLKR